LKGKILEVKNAKPKQDAMVGGKRQCDWQDGPDHKKMKLNDSVSVEGSYIFCNSQRSKKRMILFLSDTFMTKVQDTTFQCRRR